ncbi:hypothetical protein [Parageobacillus sp. VR-IP]|nr:hypothetical protein [Parageobacillus sp. VR-IP]
MFAAQHSDKTTTVSLTKPINQFGYYFLIRSLYTKKMEQVM